MVRQLAAQSLRHLGRRKAISALRGVFTDQGQDPSLRAATAEALGASFVFDSTAELIAGLSDRSPQVRFWCAYALGFMRVEGALPELERLASGDDAEVPGLWSVSKEAVWAIAEIRDNPPRE
jgi:HEAT repeat protein